MSVINKMLRDLDQRQVKATASTDPQGGVPSGTAVPADFARASSSPGESPRRGRPVLLVGAGAVLALVIGASWWAAQRAGPSTSIVASAPVVQPTAAASAASAPVVALPPTPAPSEAVPVPVPVVASPAPAPIALAAPPPSAAPPLASARREPATLGLRMDTTLTPRKGSERVMTSERAAASELPKGPTPNEALERAQALWNTGSREAAIDLLQDAVAVAERAGAGSTFAQGNPVLLPLVRELTRMQLAESRHSAVWDVLTRLEPQLGTAPDLWAIRGNAAQRLGRHQDSVHAYMTALQSRPTEQRWLLGAAVSLAALGQTSSAAEMADKARAVGVVSPEVLAYLRQMGVPLKDK